MRLRRSSRVNSARRSRARESLSLRAPANDSAPSCARPGSTRPLRPAVRSQLLRARQRARPRLAQQVRRHARRRVARAPCCAYRPRGSGSDYLLLPEPRETRLQNGCAAAATDAWLAAARGAQVCTRRGAHRPRCPASRPPSLAPVRASARALPSATPRRAPHRGPPAVHPAGGEARGARGRTLVPELQSPCTCRWGAQRTSARPSSPARSPADPPPCLQAPCRRPPRQPWRRAAGQPAVRRSRLRWPRSPR